MPTIVKLSHWKPGYYCPEKHCYMSKINYEHCYMSKILKFRPIFFEHFLHLVWHWIFNRLTSSVESFPSNFYSHLFSKYVFCAFHDRSLHLCQWWLTRLVKEGCCFCPHQGQVFPMACSGSCLYSSLCQCF